jgi:ADP-dependent NAD(P)H-hydrate dehydratase / NAD(P)H-hydrate epimerase
MKILTAAEMREVDRLSSERFGIPSFQLMENAGAAVVEYLAEHFSGVERRRIAVVCGKGNNGGDGFVVARLLFERGSRVVAILCGDAAAMKGDAAANYERFVKTGAALFVARDAKEWAAARPQLEHAAIVVDALFGTGFRGPVEGWLADVIAAVNAQRGRAAIVAVDIPSGISADAGEISGPVIEADATVTFTAPKFGQVLAPASGKVGRLHVAAIGSPRKLIEECSDSRVRWLESGEFASLTFRRSADANKGNFGHALIVAGSLGKTGAAVMAGWAALRAGAGLVTVATPEVCVPVVAAHVPEMMTEPLGASESGTISLRSLEYNYFSNLLRGKSILAIGPGLTTHAETQQFVRSVVKDSAVPMVVDADALNAHAGRGDELAQHAAAKMVITPHPGEMARLLESSIAEVQRDRLSVAQTAAAKWKTTVVLKGYQTVIAAPDGRAWINSTGNPGMAKAGSGDVLTGVLAGILAQHATASGNAADWDLAICLAVYLHGLAGDIAADKYGETSLMATDLIHAIPRAFAQLASERDDADA